MPWADDGSRLSPNRSVVRWEVDRLGHSEYSNGQKGALYMANARIDKVYLLETEMPEDSFYVPSGLVVVGERQKITVFCLNSTHNLYRSAVIRHDWEALERGVVYRNIGFRIRPLNHQVFEFDWRDANRLPDIFRTMQAQYPRHLYFLSELLPTF